MSIELTPWALVRESGIGGRDLDDNGDPAVSFDATVPTFQKGEIQRLSVYFPEVAISSLGKDQFVKRIDSVKKIDLYLN